MDIRDAFFDTLVNAAKEDPSLVFLTCDQGAWAFPDTAVNVGPAEQTAIGVAAGLALAGKRPIVYGIAAFLTARAYEQIRLDVCAHGLSVVIVGSGPGFTYAYDGPTHHGFVDEVLMAHILRVEQPLNGQEAIECATRCLQTSGPVYVRLAKGEFAHRFTGEDPGFLYRYGTEEWMLSGLAADDAQAGGERWTT